jgi:heterodisulfide reductase subunit A2
MVSVGRHENITLLSYSQVENVSGYVGNFSVQVRKKARYVDEQLCTGCGTCTEKCPWKKIPSEFDLGLGNRSAIYFPFAQAVPRLPVIDVENCAYFLKGKCRACEKFCPTGAIDFNQEDELLDLEVGTILLATGFKDFDPRSEPQYGYGELDNVLTGMEFERLVNSGGPTNGEVRLKDGRAPEKIAIIHCVGSREMGASKNGSGQNEYCSRVCCMYSLKLAHLIQDTVEAEVVEFYRDMRTFGKDYESFYERVRGEGTEFIRFDREIRVSAEKNGKNGKIKIATTDVYTGKLQEYLVDMVVLATGLEPQADQAILSRTYGISLSPDGFFLERHPKLAPVETATDGVYLAGTCQGPKDIPDSVAHGGAAAAAALSLLDAGYVTLEPFTTFVNQDKCSGCRTCEGLCPFSAIEMVQLEEADGGTRTVAYINEVLCKGCGVCAAACPAGAATQHGFTHEQVFAEISGVLQEAFV